MDPGVWVDKSALEKWSIFFLLMATWNGLYFLARSLCAAYDLLALPSSWGQILEGKEGRLMSQSFVSLNEKVWNMWNLQDNMIV